MKVHAKQARTAERPQVNADLRPRAPEPIKQAENTPIEQNEAPILDRLASGAFAQRDLDSAWQTATSSGGGPLRDREKFEEHFGRKLPDVEVYSGPEAVSLLQRLSARAAARGNEILVRPDVEPLSLTHELVHVLQSNGETEGEAKIEAPDAAAEKEAETIAQQIWSPKKSRYRKPVRTHRRLSGGVIALRRADLPVRDPDPTAPPPVGAEDLARSPRERTARRARGPPDETPSRARAVEPEPAAAEAETTETIEAEAAPREETAAPRGTGAPEVARDTELPSVDRRAQLGAVIDEAQTTYDLGATTAGDHSVEPCPSNAIEDHRHPFARGPPLETPAVREETLPEAPELERPSEETLDAERRAVGEALDEAPESAGTLSRAGLTPEESRARSESSAELDSHIRSELGADPERLEGETVAREGDSAPERAGEIEAETEPLLDTAETAGLALAEEDFGEDRIAPERDPTLGHDVGLDSLEVAELDAASLVPEDRLARVATEENAGAIPLSEVVFIEDGAMSTLDEATALEEETRAEIDEEIAASDATFSENCHAASEEQQRQLARAEEGVETRRGEWETDATDHSATRRREAEALVTEHREHADTLEREANEEAASTIEAAHREADEHWDETRDRAEAKAEQTEDTSWWRRGIDWVREQLARLTEWLTDFIEACRRAINALLDAAQAFAHQLVENARNAIAATFDLLHRGLDLIADNLPGELGEIAREYRDDIHAFLDTAQDELDQWADRLHEAIDNGIEALRTTLNTALDGLEEAVRDVAGAIDSLLENGLLAFLRAQFPELADLIEQGLNGPIALAAEALADWVDTLIDATGLGRLEEAMMRLEESDFCREQTPEEAAEDCERFERMMEDLMAEIDALLASPFLTEVRGWLQEARDEEADRQAGMLEDFFDLIASVAQPVYEWWQSIQPTLDTILDVLGDTARAIWRHVAIALGIDPDLSPLEAIQQGLQALWDGIVAVVQPVVDAAREAWRWIREDSPLAPIFDLFAMLPQLWDSLSSLWNQMTTAAGEWLAEAAQALADVILPAIKSAGEAVSEVMLTVIDATEAFGNALLAQIDLLLSWEPTLAALAAMMRILRAIAAPIRIAVGLWLRCGAFLWRKVARAVGDILTTIRTLADIATGIVQAIILMPHGIPLFFAGTVWLYLVPECYKAPIIDFFLGMIIRFIQFFPEPADFMLAAIYQGALQFFQALLEADDDLKVRAVDLFVSIFAGNVEVAAGFAVGLLEGIWESTGGTIIFILQIVWWLITLPFQLLQWAAGMMSGENTEENPEGEEAPPAETEEVETTETEPETTTTTTEADPEAPPEAPSELPNFREILSQIVSGGFTREDAEQLLDQLRAQLRTMVGSIARSAAETMLQALTAEGTAFTVGRVLGTVVGMLIVEAILAYFTAGASAGIAAARTALMGTRGGVRLASMLRRMRRAIDPILDLVARFRRSADALITRIRRWIDDVLEWMRNIFRRRRPTGPHAPHGPAPHGPRPDAPDAPNRPPGDGPDAPSRPRDGPLDADDGSAIWAAERGSRLGWAQVSLIAERRLMTEAQIENRLRNVHANTSRMRVTLSVDHDTVDRDGWNVQATAMGHGERETRHHGQGWRARDDQNRNWYTTAADQGLRHRRIIENAEERIEREGRDAVRNARSLRDVHQALRTTVQQAERNPNPDPLEPITLRIDEARFDPGHDARGAQVLNYHYEIGPNNGTGVIQSNLPLYPAAAGIYGTMISQGEQEKHHVPPKGVLAWIKAEATGAVGEIPDDEVGSTIVLLERLSNISDTLQGLTLSAIAIHANTHRVREDAPLGGVWRVHYGRETAAEVGRRMEGAGHRPITTSTARDSGVTTLGDLNATELDDLYDDVAANMAARDGISVETARARVTPADAEEFMRARGISTQFYQSQLRRAREDAPALEESEHLSGWERAADRHVHEISDVARRAARQSYEAVDAALEHSTLDGDRSDHRSALQELRRLMRTSWHRQPGVEDLNLFW